MDRNPVHGTEINSEMEHANQSQHKSQKKVNLVLFVLTLRLVRAFCSTVDFLAMWHRPYVTWRSSRMREKLDAFFGSAACTYLTYFTALGYCRSFRPNLRKQIITYKIIESGLYNSTYYKLQLLFTNYLLYSTICILCVYYRQWQNFCYQILYQLTSEIL